MSIPNECHLYHHRPLTAELIRASLAPVKEYTDDLHLIRSLLRCSECGQLYFHEFFEIVDWVNGNDAQYSSWIPVADEASADQLSLLSPMELNAYGGIHVDFPSGADEPTAPYWTGRGPGP